MEEEEREEEKKKREGESLLECTPGRTRLEDKEEEDFSSLHGASLPTGLSVEIS